MRFRLVVLILACCLRQCSSQQPSSITSTTTGTPPPISTTIEYETANWTLATATGDLRESQYYPAYYIDLAPCTCDLSPVRCDAFCCCDPLCDEAIKRVLFGQCPSKENEKEDATEKVSSGALAQFSQHLKLLLKEHYATTPYLGHYYASVPLTIRSATTYTELSTRAIDPDQPTFGSTHDYPEWESLMSPTITNRAGSVVRNAAMMSYEALPAPTFGGDGRACTFRSAVRFLENSNATCVRMVTDQTCANDSSLNVISYMHAQMAMVLPPSLLIPSSTTPPPSPTTTTPSMDNSTEDIFFEPSSSSSPIASESTTTTARPAEFSPDEGVRTIYSCESPPGVDPWTRRPSDCTVIPSAQSSRIVAPTVQNNTRSCRSVVAAVLFRFEWSGRRVINSTEIYLIDSIAWGAQLTQSFSVQWIHRGSGSESINGSTATSTTTPTGVRMWPGYVVDDPIYGISGVFNETLSANIAQPPPSPSLAHPVPLLGPDPSSSSSSQCPRSFDPSVVQFEPVRFGPSGVESGCYLSLSKDAFADCDTIRSDLWTNWRTLYQDISFVSKYSFASVRAPFRVDQVVQLLRPNFDDESEEDLPEEATTIDDSSSTTIVVPIDNDENINNPNENLTRRFLDEYEELRRKPRLEKRQQQSSSRSVEISTDRIDYLPFACDRLPVEARLEIMYAESARINGTILNAIVGAMLRFRRTSWRFSNRIDSRQNFFVKNSIRFIKVPATESKPIKRYYLTERRDHCPSLVTCWDELFYPFMDWIPTESYRYTLSIGLAMIIGVIGVFLISRPWW